MGGSGLCMRLGPSGHGTGTMMNMPQSAMRFSSRVWSAQDPRKFLQMPVVAHLGCTTYDKEQLRMFVYFIITEVWEKKI